MTQERMKDTEGKEVTEKRGKKSSNGRVGVGGLVGGVVDALDFEGEEI